MSERETGLEADSAEAAANQQMDDRAVTLSIPDLTDQDHRVRRRRGRWRDASSPHVHDLPTDPALGHWVQFDMTAATGALPAAALICRRPSGVTTWTRLCVDPKLLCSWSEAHREPVRWRVVNPRHGRGGDRLSIALVFTLTMDRQRLNGIAHSHHPIAAPIFGVNVNRLLRRADQQPSARILDLGCGEGAWALQALAHYPDGHADGIDVSPYALGRAGAAAAERGLTDRVTLHERDARTYLPDGDYDLVLRVGSTLAFGGFAEALQLARSARESRRHP